MTGKKPSPIGKFLAAAEPGLAALTAQASRLEALRRHAVQALPPEAAPHCLGADLKEGVLTLYLDSGAWSTFLHYRQAALLAGLCKTLGAPCHNLKFKVLPEPVPGVPSKPAPKDLSADTRGLLESTAAGLEDAALAEALRRLARDKGPRS
jgi:hypothetical protein